MLERGRDEEMKGGPEGRTEKRKIEKNCEAEDYGGEEGKAIESDQGIRNEEEERI